MTYIIVEAALVIVSRCVSQEGEMDEINDQGVQPQLAKLLN